MSSTKAASNTIARTQVLQANRHSYAYRRFGNGSGLPLLFLQHFTGTLDNWDPAVTDPLASGREVILFDNAGLGRSTGEVPHTVAEMAGHAMAFLDGLGIKRCDVLGYSLGGMVALQMVQDRPSIFRRMMLVGTAPRGGEDIMHLEKPSLAKHLQDPTNRGYDVLKKIFFTSSRPSQAAGEAFIQRLSQRKEDLDPPAGPNVAGAQIAAFREWETPIGQPSPIPIDWPRTWRMPCCSLTRTRGTAPYSSTRSLLSGRRRRSCPPTPRRPRSKLSEQRPVAHVHSKGEAKAEAVTIVLRIYMNTDLSKRV